MMDDRDGDGMTALQVTQEGEQRRDLAADILVDAVQTHERIKDEQPRLQPGDGLVEPCAVGLEIEAQAGRGDHLDVEFGESGAGGGADALKAAADDVQGILGGIEQDPTGTRDREATQAGCSGGDGCGQIEGEEGFAAFGLAADDADRLFRPQLIDQPAPLLGSLGLRVATVSSSRARSASRSRRRLGAVITWTSSAARLVQAAAQMPSRRRRTTCSASSAG